MASGLSNSRNSRVPGSNAGFLLHYLYPYRFRLAAASVLVLLSVIMGAWPIKVVEHFVDALKDGRVGPALIRQSVGLILLLAAAAGVMLFFQRRFITVASRAMEYDIRRDFLDYLHGRPAAFYHKNQTGHIMSRVTNDLSRVREMIGAGILHMLRTGLSMIVIIVFMLSISVKYTLIILVPVAVLPFISAGLLRKMKRMYEALQEKLAHMNSVVQETFAGIAAVKAYHREAWRERLFNAANDDYFD